MIQRVLGSKGVVAYVLACATGLTLYFRWPFPADDLMLHLIALRAPAIYLGFKYAYTLFLFTTPYIGYSLVLSGLYIFAYRPSRKLKPKELPPYPDAAARNDLFLVLGEIHDSRRPAPSEDPYWLAIPERGLFTGIAIFGAIGTGKTSGCMYPYAEQLIAYRANDPAQRIGGLVLEVKGDFCRKVKDILTRHGRESDYVEVNLNADYRYNPLYNNLDAYALAYNIASLLSNLFGKGKEPFWQQAYTNLVKFIIQLHKVAFDYVTLFDVYECAINPELLESRIQEAERRIAGERFVLVDDVIFRAHPELEPFGFVPNGPGGNHKATESKPLIEILGAAAVKYESRIVPPPVRRAKSFTADFHVPEALLQRREQIVLSPVGRRGTLMTITGFELILPFLRPIQHLILDPAISEIMVNGPEHVFIEREGRVEAIQGLNLSPKSLEVAVRNIARRLGDDISEEKPVLDSRLPDGSRVAVVVPPCSLHGVTLTIRKFNAKHFGIEDLLRIGTITEELADTLKTAIINRQNILISGGTGTGKTTLLNILAHFIPAHERILIIEDTAEIQISARNLVRFEARVAQNGIPAVTIRELLKASLRHRPDRILLGEIRGAEAFDLLQLLNTGHSGTLSTVHANSALQAINRFTSCVLQSNVEIPYRAIKSNIADSLNLLVHVERRPGRRFVSEVLEITGYSPDSDRYDLKRLFVHEAGQ